MSDTNRTRVSYQVEASLWGTPPTINTAPCIDARYTGESIKQTTNTTQSQEIRSDRNIADLLRVGLSGDGDLNVELSYPGNSGFLYDMLRGSMMSADWTAASVATSATTTNVFTVANVSGLSNTITSSGGSATNWTTNYAVGQWVRMANFVVTANNTIGKVTAVTATVLTVVTAAAMSAEVISTGAATVTRGSYIRNGVAVPTPTVSASNSFLLEKNFADLTNEYEQARGSMVDKFSINVAADQIATGSFSYLAKSVVSAAGTGNGNGYTAPSSAPVYSGVDNVLATLEGANGATPTAITLTALTAQIQNNLRARLEIGQLGATSVGAGSANVTGTINAYYSDNSTAVMDRYLNGTAASLSIIFKDTTPNYWVIDFPRIKYTSGQRVAGGINSDVMLEMDFQALYGSATEAWTVSFTKF